MVQFADALVLAIVATSTIAPVLALPAPIVESENALEVRARPGVRMANGKRVGSSPRPKKAAKKPSAPAPAKKSVGGALSKAGHVINGLVVATGVGATVAGVVNTYNSNKASEEQPPAEQQAREYDDEFDYFAREFDDEVELEARSRSRARKASRPAAPAAPKKSLSGAFSKIGHIANGLVVATGVGATVAGVVQAANANSAPAPPAEQQAREYDDEIDYFAREFDDEVELEARAPRRSKAKKQSRPAAPAKPKKSLSGAFSKIGHIANGLVVATGVGATVAGVVQAANANSAPAPAEEQQAREYDDEIDYFAREFDDEELEARGILGKAIGHAGTLAGIASTVQSFIRPPVYRRELDDEFDLMAREYFYDELE